MESEYGTIQTYLYHQPFQINILLAKCNTTNLKVQLLTETHMYTNNDVKRGTRLISIVQIILYCATHP